MQNEANEVILPTKDEGEVSEHTEQAAEVTSEESAEVDNSIPDFEKMASEDLAEIKRLFPSFSDISHLRELDRASRFGEMREAGFSVEEALMATNYERIFETVIKRARQINGKSHLMSVAPAASGNDTGGMTVEEMREAKEIFGDLSDREIQALYKRAKS